MSILALAQAERGDDNDMRPYRQLWASVLWQAVYDVVRNAKAVRPTPRAIFVEASEWFASDAIYVGSFSWVCDLMNLDHERVRERVGRMVKKAKHPSTGSLPRFLVQMV